MDEEVLKLKRPVALEASYFREAGTVITGLQIPFGALVRFFVKAWFAWLIASFVIFVLVGIPLWFVIASYESGENMREARQSLEMPSPASPSNSN